MALQQDVLVEARQFFERTARGALASGDPELLALSKLALARWYDRFGSPREGQRLLDSALSLFHKHGIERMSPSTSSLVLNRAVRFMVGRGQLLRARGALHDLQRLAQTSHLPMARCRAEWAMAVFQRANGDLAAARATLASARNRAVNHDLVALGIELMREEAAAALEAGDHEAVIDTAQKLIDSAHQHQDAYSAQRGLDVQAASCCVLGRDVPQAMNHLMMSLSRAQEREVPKDVYRCHLLLAIALNAQGRTQDAEKHGELAEGIASRFRYAA
jgi:tetratricopeptide (TPR) repeat protein